MGLYLKQNDNRSELQEKLAMELQDKARKKAKEEELPDGVTDSAYLRDTKQTTGLAWAWVFIIIAAVVIALWIIVS